MERYVDIDGYKEKLIKEVCEKDCVSECESCLVSKAVDLLFDMPMIEIRQKNPIKEAEVIMRNYVKALDEEVESWKRVIRCDECRWCKVDGGFRHCMMSAIVHPTADDYCSLGERREDAKIN